MSDNLKNGISRFVSFLEGMGFDLGDKNRYLDIYVRKSRC